MAQLAVSYTMGLNCILCGSFQKFYVWWQHRAVLDMTELKNHVCDANGTVASVTKMQRPCDVSCVAMDQDKLQGSFSWVDVRTLI
jgi:hypothetical protein